MAANRRFILLLTLLVATAGVASAAPAQGSLTIAGGLGLEGDIRLQPSAGALLARVGEDPAGSNVLLSADASLVNVTRVTWTRTVVNNPQGGGPVTVESEPTVEYAEYRDAHVEVTGIDPEARLLVLLDAPAGGLLRLTDAKLQGVTRSILASSWAGHNSADQGGSHPAQFTHVVTQTFETASPAGGHAALTGDLRVYARGATLQIQGADGRGIYQAGDKSGGPGDFGAGEVVERSFLLLRLEGANLTHEVQGGGLAWYGPVSGLRIDGAIAAATAQGKLRVGQDEHPARADSILLRGNLLLEATRRTAGEDNDLVYQTTVYDPEFDVALDGDVTFVSIQAAPRAFHEAPAVVAAAATGLTLFAVALYFWPTLKYVGTLALLPLYTRLTEPDILNNEVRNQIYEIIRQNPGMSARAIHRRSGQSWGTVVYHLRQLERHHLVKSRRVGRSRNFYENHGKYAGMEVELAVLKNARSLALAQFILAAPGITQEGLKELADLPQPTTSYYVRKLKDAGLIEERREGRYSRYFPQPELENLVRILTEGNPGEAAGGREEALA